jgi:cobalt transporter subunit CbtA
MPGIEHEDEGWQPADGVERTLFTALTTVLSAIGYSAVLFGVASLRPVSLTWQRGALLGFAAYVCVDLAPALGLPPQPPGTAVGDIYARQLWWLATVVLTAVGLWLLLDRRKAWSIRLVGLAALVLPHVIGPPAAAGQSFVPAQLIHRFATVSVLTTGVFWLLLGSTGGLLYERFVYAERE